MTEAATPVKTEEKPEETKAPSESYVEISAAMKAVRSNLTRSQRASSRFAEAPRIGDRTLRRGQVLRLSSEQLDGPMGLQVTRLMAAGAIDIHEVHGDKKRKLAWDQTRKRVVDHDHMKADLAADKEAKNSVAQEKSEKAKAEKEAKTKVKEDKAMAERKKVEASAPLPAPTGTVDAAAKMATDLAATQQVKVVVPPEAKGEKENPLATTQEVVPVNPVAAASADAEVNKIVDSIAPADAPAAATEKVSKKAKSSKPSKE
jgi:hypothetical protein